MDAPSSSGYREDPREDGIAIDMVLVGGKAGSRADDIEMKGSGTDRVGAITAGGKKGKEIGIDEEGKLGRKEPARREVGIPSRKVRDLPKVAGLGGGWARKGKGGGSYGIIAVIGEEVRESNPLKREGKCDGKVGES